MILADDVARCPGITKKGLLALRCATCSRRAAYVDDHKREVDRMLVMEPPASKPSECRMRIDHALMLRQRDAAMAQEKGDEN